MAADARPTQARTDTHWQRFAVPYEFPVVFTEGVFDPENPALRDVLCRLEPAKRHRVVFFVDDGLNAGRAPLAEAIARYAQRHSDVMELACAPVVVPGGEKIKSDLHFVESVQQTLFDLHIDRHSYVIAVGGGAVLDAIGLVASTTHRGVRHIRIPTTVLAQNDSGVGVKNGVNLQGVKNFVGTFAPPFAVLNDLEFVMTLPDRDKIAGMAEAVKVSLIRDAEFFGWIERHMDDLATFERSAMATMIRRCAELHMRQIGLGGDPFEAGSVTMNSMSFSTANGGAKVPTKFFTPCRLTPFFTPTPESFCASTVVGMRMWRTPRCVVEATRPMASSTAPPPTAMTKEWRSMCRSNSVCCTLSTKCRSDLIFSPPGTATGAQASSITSLCRRAYCTIASGSGARPALRPSSTNTTTRWRLAGSSRHSTSRSAGFSGSNTPSVKMTGNS